MCWCVFLYSLLTLARAPKVWGLQWSEKAASLCKGMEPRISANLSNQFEWPVFFYIACLVLMMKALDSNIVSIALAWVFILGRVIHRGVQILTNNVRLRGLVFTINFLAVLAMRCLLILAL
ncbi:hypothetical protein A3746_28790 [Oleibacter sp. HI0075]|nr:hypothetical protein A3746_28790 [Oleibacter sp. HI0075]